MQIIRTKIKTFEDFDNDEGWVLFSWTNELGYPASLEIDLDGYCSREMPIRSGQGPPVSLGLQRDRLKLRFPGSLAAKLELDDVIEFQFSIDNGTFEDLRQFNELWHDSPGLPIQ